MCTFNLQELLLLSIYWTLVSLCFKSNMRHYIWMDLCWLGSLNLCWMKFKKKLFHDFLGSDVWFAGKFPNLSNETKLLIIGSSCWMHISATTMGWLINWTVSKNWLATIFLKKWFCPLFSKQLRLNFSSNTSNKIAFAWKTWKDFSVVLLTFANFIATYLTQM